MAPNSRAGAGSPLSPLNIGLIGRNRAAIRGVSEKFPPFFAGTSGGSPLWGTAGGGCQCMSAGRKVMMDGK